MTIWKAVRTNSRTWNVYKREIIMHKQFRSHKVRKVTNVSSFVWQAEKMQCSLFPLSFSFSVLFSYLPTTLALPQGRLIKTNAIVGYHCYAGAQRAAASYFSFSLVWWCDFVFFRNRFVSNGSVYLSSLPPFPYSLCARLRMECFGLHCHITQSADFRAALNRANFTLYTWCSV